MSVQDGNPSLTRDYIFGLWNVATHNFAQKCGMFATAVDAPCGWDSGGQNTIVFATNHSYTNVPCLFEKCPISAREKKLREQKKKVT